MKILACAKVVRDYDKVLQEDWEDAAALAEDFPYVNRVFSAFDEAALETALRLRDAALAIKENAEASVVSVAADATLLAGLYAVGFGRVTRIAPPSGYEFNPGVTAATLAAHVRASGGFDVILCGRQAGPGDNGRTGVILAGRLGLPCLTNVVDVGFDNALRVTRQVEGGRLRLTVKSPIVLVVDNALHSYLRLPTLREKLAAKGRSVAEEFHAASSDSPHVRLVSLRRIKNDRNCRMIADGTLADTTRTVYDEYLSDIGVKS